MEPPVQPTPPLKARSLADILNQLGPISNVSYTPFQPEEPRQLARALLPPLFPQRARPIDYFTLFFTRDLFQTITMMLITNKFVSKIH